MLFFTRKIKTLKRQSFLLIVSVLFAATTILPLQTVNARARELGVVNANYVSVENQGDPDDYIRLLLHSSERGKGFFRMDRAPVTSDWTPELINQWRVFWLGGQITCTNVDDNQAVVFGRINDVGDFPESEQIPVTLAEVFGGQYFVMQLIDNGSGEFDDMKMVLQANPESDTTYSRRELRKMCRTGTIGNAEYLEQSVYHSGDISIYKTNTRDYGEREVQRRVLRIPEQVADIGDEGLLNHGCSGGLYTLVDGLYRERIVMNYYPTKAAVEAAEVGSFMTVDANVFFGGKWNNDQYPDQLYRLRGDRSISSHADIWPAVESQNLTTLDWSGRFVNMDTKETTDWWEIDALINADGVASGVSEGTCGDISNWDTYDLNAGGPWSGINAVDANFIVGQNSESWLELWEQQQFEAVFNEGVQESFQWFNPEDPENDFVHTDLHCALVSAQGSIAYANFAGQIRGVGNPNDEHLIDQWYIVQLGFDITDGAANGVQYMHVGDLTSEETAFNLCENLTTDIGEYPEMNWRTIIIPEEQGYINFSTIE